MDEITVWPDAQRGIHAMIEGVELMGFELVPSANPSREDFAGEQSVVVQLETADTREGDVDRVQEVRLTVFGPSTYQSKDIFEAVLSYISGTDIETPAMHTWPSFYFDEIHRNQGPSSPAYPDDTLYPAMGTVLCRARPMA